MKRVAVMCSGSGSNLQALLDAEARGQLGAEIVLVIVNREGAYALERASSAGRKALYLSPRRFETEELYATELMRVLREHRVDMICLAGYLKKLPPTVIAAYRGWLLNIHPGPLPRFGGAGMYGHHVHEAVLAAGASHSGPTIHFVDEEYDRGPIIAHTPVPVLPDDTPAALAARVLTEEHRLYPRVVAAVATGRIRLEGDRVAGTLDT